MARSTRATQPILGLVAPRPTRPLSPFQREMLRRAGTILSPGEQQAARARADREEAAAAARRQPRDERADTDAMNAKLAELGIPVVLRKMPR